MSSRGKDFDYVLTVCDNAEGELPGVLWGMRRSSITTSTIRTAIEGSQERRLSEFRRVRDELRAYLRGASPSSRISGFIHRAFHGRNHDRYEAARCNLAPPREKGRNSSGCSRR